MQFSKYCTNPSKFEYEFLFHNVFVQFFENLEHNNFKIDNI